jgi:plastocyanin
LDGTTVLAEDNSYTSPGTPKSLSHTFYTSGIYYVLVRPYSSSYDSYGDYQLQISTSDASKLFVSKDELRFVETQGEGNLTTESIVTGNSGSGTFSWTASSDQTWLNISPTSGSAGSPTAVKISSNIDALTPGDYTAQITITAGDAADSPKFVQVTLRVDPPLSPATELESNNTPSTASTLSVGWLFPTIAHLTSSSDIDWFKLSVTQDHWYVFETYNVSSNLDTRLALYDTDGSTQISYDYSDGTGNTLSRIVWQAPASDTYYLRVSSSSGAGPYSIRALQKYNEGATWDGFHEPNDTWQTAHLINVGREDAIHTTIYPRGPYSTNTGDYDYFRFHAELGDWYVIETFNVAPTLDSRLALYDVNGTSQLDYNYDSAKGNGDARIVWQAPQTAVFYIQVRAESSSQEGSYSLRVLPKYDEGASWDANWEPDDIWVTASPVILNQTQNRNLYQRGNYTTHYADYDTFWFTAQAGYEYTVDLQSVAPTLRANLYLLSLDGTTVLAEDNSYTSPGTPKSLSYTFATPGNYYILVRPYSSSYDNYGDYGLRVTSVVPAIEVSLESIALDGSLGEASTQHEQLIISNSGFGSFSWSITTSASWLNASPTSGTAPPNTHVDVWAELTGMPLGTYTGTLTINADGIENSPYVIPLTLEVKEIHYTYLPVVIKSY